MFKLFLIAFCSLIVSAFEISQIIDVDGNYRLKFDSNSNCYVTIVVVNCSDHRFYKLDSDNNIVLQANLSNIYDIVITSKDDVYLFGADTVDTIWLLEHDTTELQPIFKYPNLGYITAQGTFIDKEDNILFNTKNGIVILKPDLNIPIAVGNLDSYYFSAVSTAVDQQGNIYLARVREGSSAEIVVITSTSKHQPVPYATEVQELKDSGMRVYEIAADVHDNIIFSVQFSDLNGKVKVLRNGTVVEILSQYRIHHYLSFGTKNRVFLIAADPDPQDGTTFTCSLYFIDGDTHVHRIDRIFDLIFWYEQIQTVSDKNDNIFFVNDAREVLWLRNDEDEIRELFMSNYTISRIFVDSSNVLWVIGDGNYYLVSLNTGDFVEYSDTSLGSVQVVEENVKTGEIYAASRDGLFVLRS